jgi:hypothetical protein
MNALRISFVPALFALCALPVGCATDEAPASDPADPIASVALPNGNTFEFYESSPGFIYMSESGVSGTTPTPRAGRNPVELYRALAPGQPMPAALVAAQARAEVLRPAPASVASEAAAGRKANPPQSSVAPHTANFINNEACDDQWFNNNFCVGSPDWSMCLLNHTGGAFAQLSSVDFVQHVACADTGPITLKVQMGDGTGTIRDIPLGGWRSFSWQDECVFGCNTSTRGDILNASGDRFHYAVNAWF